MATSQPAIVIVPGAWHQPSAYGKLVTALESKGYTAVATSLPSCNADEPLKASCSTDAAAVRSQVLSLLDNENKDVILLCHSYGGIPGGGAASGLSKRARRQDGKESGILGLVYLTAFLVPEKSSLLEAMGGKHAPYVIPDQPSPNQCTIQDARNVLHNDLDDAESEDLIRLLRPTSMRAFDTSAPPQAWAEAEYAGNLAFIRCMQDHALPLPLQNMFMEKTGVQWKVGDIEASHSAFASKPEELVEILGDLAQQFGD